MDGYYDYEKRVFIETLFSPLNIEDNSYVNKATDQTTDETTKKANNTNTASQPPTPSPKPQPEPYVDDQNDEILGSLYCIDFKINFNEKITDENYTIYDFADVLNIGTGPNQNHLA